MTAAALRKFAKEEREEAEQAEWRAYMAQAWRPALPPEKASLRATEVSGPPLRFERCWTRT
jgi:hypothetical protein